MSDAATPAPSPSPATVAPPPPPQATGRFALDPLQRRRWENFKANKRGFWSLWLFLVLFVVALCAEFVANDKPILVQYRGASKAIKGANPRRPKKQLQHH